MNFLSLYSLSGSISSAAVRTNGAAFIAADSAASVAGVPPQFQTRLLIPVDFV